MLPGERQLILKLGHMILDHTHHGMRIFPSTLIATAVLQNTGGISLGEIEEVRFVRNSRLAPMAGLSFWEEEGRWGGGGGGGGGEGGGEASE